MTEIPTPTDGAPPAAATPPATTPTATTVPGATGDGKSLLDPGTTPQAAQTDAEKAAAQAATEAKAKADADAAAAKAPEKYELQFADGMQVDAARTTEFETLARQMNLSQEAAQKLVDFVSKNVAADAKANDDAVKALIEKDRAACAADKEIGGVDFEKNRAVALTAIQKFGSPELIAVLNSTGIGDNPEMLRFAYRVGKAIAEDSVVNGASGGAGQRSLADVAYGDSMKNI